MLTTDGLKKCHGQQTGSDGAHSSYKGSERLKNCTLHPGLKTVGFDLRGEVGWRGTQTNILCLTHPTVFGDRYIFCCCCSLSLKNLITSYMICLVPSLLSVKIFSHLENYFNGNTAFNAITTWILGWNADESNYWASTFTNSVSQIHLGIRRNISWIKTPENCQLS